jgi:two-component system KDP operon response regulator KdpE
MNNARTILVVDDEKQIRRFLRTGLSVHGYEVIEAESGAEAVREASTKSPDLVVLDLQLGDMDGLDVLQRIREWSSLPVLILSVRNREVEKVKALELGADDYMTKPFSPRTLIARIKALLRRSGMETSSPLAAGRLALDVDEHTARVDEGEPVRLTKLELRLLQMLLANAGRTVNSDRLLMQVWGHRNSGDRQLLKQLVHRLRQKIEKDPAAPQLLQTSAGTGYKLVVE